MDDSAIDLRELVAVLRQRWPLVAAVTLGVGVIAALVAAALPNQYTATAYIEVAKSRTGTLTGRDEALDTFTYYVREQSALRETMAKHGLDQPPHAMPVHVFERRVNVRQVRNTGLIEVSVTLGDPVMARDVALELSERAIALNNALLEKEKEQSVKLQQTEYDRVFARFEDVRDRYQQQSMTADARALNEQLMSLGVLLRNIEHERALAAAGHRDREARVRSLYPALHGPEAIGPVYSVTRSISEYQDHQNLLEGVLETAAPKARPFDLLPVTVVVQERNPAFDELQVHYQTWKAERDGYAAQVAILDASAHDVLKRMHDVETRLMQGQVLVEALEKEFEKVSDILRLQLQFLNEAAARVISERQDLRLLGEPRAPERKSGPQRTAIVMISMLFAAGAATFFCVVLDLAALASRRQEQRRQDSP